MKILLKNARILKMDDSPLFNGDIVVIDDRIAYIGNNSSSYGPFDITRDCKGNVLMPGFKNAHTHSAMTFLRSKTDDCKLQTWLFDVVFPREEHLKPEDVYHLSKVAFLEYLTSGITACFDQYFFPPMIGKAAEDIGMRTLLLGTFSNDHASQSHIDELYYSYNDKEDSLVRYCVGIHAEYTTNDSEFKIIQDKIKSLKSPFFTHVSETKKEVEECIKRRGMTPVQYMDSLGLFDYGGGCYHCCYLTDEDVKIFKKHNLSVVTCPGSNSKLASGIAPISRYMKEGLNIGIGTDGPASNNSLDMFKEMMLVTNLQKLQLSDPSAVPAYEVLKMATVGGARAMNLKDCDILAVGKKADIIEIDLSRPSMQPLNNIVNNIVYAGGKDIIKMTMINGKILYDSGLFYVGEDVQEIYKKCQEVTDRIEKEL